MTTFNHLNVPDQWNQYFTKYPQGYTILEALLNWVQQVNDLTDNVNDWNARLDEFIAEFDTELQQTVKDILSEWQASGLLNDIISEALQTEMDKFKEIIVYITDARFGAKGDGVTDDTAKIQAAIDYVYSRGGGIVGVPFSAQPFIFTEIKVKTNVTLKGYGGTLKLKDNVCVDTSKNYYLVHDLDQQNVTFDGLIIDGNQVNNVSFTVADGITCGGKNSKVINCTINNAPDSGIMFSTAEKGRCQNNRISNCRDLGIYVNANAPDVISEAIISGNIIDSCVYGGIGIKRETTHVIVTNNSISSCGNGITVENFESSGQGYPKHIQVIGNTMRDIGYVYRGKPNLAECGISISKTMNSIFANNKIYNCSGIVINAGLGSVNTIISDNIVEGYPTNPVTGSTYNNTGILVSSMTDCVIKGNMIKNVNDYGIYLVATDGGRVSDNEITSPKTALRVNANCLTTLIKDNVCKGTTADVEYYAGNTCYIKDNIQKSAAAGTPNFYGKRTIASGQPLPSASAIAPFFVGEIIQYLTDNSIWIGTGTAAGNWTKLSN